MLHAFFRRLITLVRWKILLYNMDNESFSYIVTAAKEYVSYQYVRHCALLFATAVGFAALAVSE